MYNHFTAIDQRPLPMGKVILNPMQLPKAGKRKKKKAHSKNPYKIKKIKLLGQQAIQQKNVDGLLLLRMLHFEHPRQIITANISYKKIVNINPDHLEYFSNLIQLNCSQNYIRLQQLRKLPSVQKINISHNQIRDFNLESGGFNCLQSLNLSFNFIQTQYIPQLTLIPCLLDLDLSYNQLVQLPSDMTNFTLLKKLNLQGNKFKSDQKASIFWASLATISRLQILSVSRNNIRGIHTQKLMAGNFSNLIELDFSYNIVENQHNLICSRNFISLKKLYITGNPFAINNQYKGLQMQVYARTGAEVIIENTNPYYLKKQRQKKPPIKFEKIVKIQTDDILKRKNNLFGIELPQEDQLFTSDSQDQIQQEPVEESQGQQPMFVTEQINKKKSKKQQERQLDISQINIPQSAGEKVQSNQQEEEQIPSLNSSMASKSIQYGQFHKVAAQLLGSQKQYKKGFDIHTSYKALKKAVDRAKDQPLII